MLIPAHGATRQPTYGPWQAGIDAAERRARCRALRAITALIVGPHPILAQLADAETDLNALAAAGQTLADLPARRLRRVLSSYAHLQTAGGQK